MLGAMDDEQHWQDEVARQLVATALDEGAALLRWLDIGLGDGAAIAAALDAGVERIDAVDPDPQKVRAAEERFDRSVVGLRIGDPAELGGFVGPYDVVLSALTLDIHDSPQVLHAMHDLLSYGSVAWVALRERGPSEPAGAGVATRDELATAAAEAGWTGDVRELDTGDEVPFTTLVVSTGP